MTETIGERLRRRLTFIKIIKWSGIAAVLALAWPYILPRKEWLALAWLFGGALVLTVTDVVLRGRLLRCPRCNAEVAPRGAIPASCPKCGVNFGQPQP
jgi:hypothetical protein